MGFSGALRSRMQGCGVYEIRKPTEEPVQLFRLPYLEDQMTLKRRGPIHLYYEALYGI